MTSKVKVIDFKTYVSSLQHNKVLDWSKLKAFADNKINATEKLKFVVERIENIVRKGENAGCQQFFFFSFLGLDPASIFIIYLNKQLSRRSLLSYNCSCLGCY